ncbi:transmembrane protease serine 9 [Clinocottus analis]|uniref:transmembrane protease serine 9 n=1 Tax=Clinocottus analis TaxID=304258 RepID=UPI0035BFF2B0
MHTLHGFVLLHLLTCLGLHALGSEIINGQDVPENLMLYMASVQSNGAHACGGFLINEHFVVTAAHCLPNDQSVRNLSVVLGTHNLRKVDNNAMRYDVKACKYPSYVNIIEGDDIMLLKLSRKAQLDKKVQPIPLPNAEMKMKDKSKCRVAGWGSTRTRGEAVKVLKVVGVSIVNLEACKNKWAHRRTKLPANVTCAGGYDTKNGFCQGDSGGPLVCGGKAVGVVSFNLEKNCDYPNLPNVYTNISKYLPWIKKILKRNNSDGSEIINGANATKNSMPYMAALFNKNGLVCGGSLIRDNFVLTAAHCDKFKLTSVVLGTNNVRGSDGVKMMIDKTIIHEHFQTHDLSAGYDIMLLKLRTKAELGDKIQTINLPTTEINPSAKCKVAGWGATKSHGYVVDDLNVVDVSIINLEHCEKEWWYRLPKGVICAGGENTGKGFCQGDSGGPLVCNEKAVGVVSFNDFKKCDYNTNTDVPNVYTDTMATSYLLLLLFALNGVDGSRIVGGRDAAPHSRPYMASLQIRGGHTCGGVLVREDFVLTAAHCQVRRSYTVVLGADSLTANEPAKQEFSAIRSFPHPNYDGHANDIMLLKLDRPAQLTAAVQLILPKSGRLNASSRCITTGWGDVGDNNTLPNTLQEVNVTLLRQRTCRRRWATVPITRTMVCGTGARVFQGFCSGDSGGPLVCDGAAAGVVSFSGRRCGNPRTPDVYTRISSFRQWIASVLSNN